MSLVPALPERQFIDVATVPRWLTVSGERVAMAAFVVAAVVLRVAAVFRYRIDSDEPQHLHIVWGWTHGLLQYRDLFDNHMPLFQILSAPLLRMVGERADALIAMRLAVLPLYAVMIALTWQIAVSCYPRRVAMWSTIVAALFPLFVLCSVEYRTDDLWTVFWLASIAILVRGPLTITRVALGGLMLGMAAAVSAKTTLLLLSVAVGAAALFFTKTGRLRAGRHTALFLLAFAIPPAVIALYFAARRAWNPFFYGAITHNIVNRFHGERILLLPGLLILIAFLAQRIGDLPRRLFLFVTTHVYAVALYCLWPLIEHEHWMPYFPLAAITIVPLFFTVRRAAAIAIAEIVLVVAIGGLQQNQTRDGLAVIEQTLQLTAPGESVMDLKGETVFRPRAFFYVLEPLTKRRIHMGQIRDTIIADLLRTRTMVVTEDHYGFPRATRWFLRRNFVSVGAVRVAGRILRENSFQIAVPAEYAIVGEKNAFAGLLDGRPYVGPRYLAAGMHSVAPMEHRLQPVEDGFHLAEGSAKAGAQSLNEGHFALLWARAAARGFSPFGISRPLRKPSPFRHVPMLTRGCYAQGNHGVQRHSLSSGDDECGERQADSQDGAARPVRDSFGRYAQRHHHGHHLESADR